MRLCVLHNLYYYNHLMEDIREAIEEGRYARFKKETLAKMEEKEDQDKKFLKCLDECPIIVYDGNSVYFSRRKEK